MNRTVCFRAAAVALAVAAGGCGGGVTYSPVEGVVRIDGVPAEGINVEFVPDPDRGNTGLPSRASSGEAGRYRLERWDPHAGRAYTGAVAGWHRVTLSDLRVEVAEQGEPLKPSRVPEAYSVLSSTPLTFEVKAGAQTIDINIMSK